MSATGFVAAGGKSSRMGRDKAWLEIDGEPMIQHVIRAILPVTGSVRILASGPEYSRLGLPVHADSHAGIGPIEAIRSALENCQTRCAVIAACDMPFITPGLVSLLLSRLDGFEVVVPMGPDGNLEPLCAVYSASVLRPVTQLIEAGERKLSRIYERVKSCVVPFSAFEQLPGSSLFFRNINTPAEYDAAINGAAR